MLIKFLFNREENFELTNEGNIDKYLGVNMQKYKDGRYELRQPFLIDRIIEALNLDNTNTQKRPIPVCKLLLHKDLKGKSRVKTWNCR